MIANRSPCLAADKDVMGEETEEERNVGLRNQVNIRLFDIHIHICIRTLTPRIRNSTRARSIFRRATSYVVPVTVHFTSKLS